MTTCTNNPTPSSTSNNLVKSTSLTRKSIKKYFPLGVVMSQGNNNPLTIHSVNEEVFPRLWSFLAEVMIVEGVLTRSTKEAVALMVSSKNHCPMCVTAHKMMGAAAKRAESTKDQAKLERQLALHNVAMDYAEKLIDETLNSRNGDEDFCMLEEILDSYSYNLSINLAPAAQEDDYDVPLLTAACKAEVAMVIVLYNHMNRIISACLGEQMSTAMFSVPKPAARRMESNSVMGVVNKMMAPILAGGMRRRHSPGITASLFPVGSSCMEYMPERLQGAESAGEERAIALSRLVAWVAVYEKRMVEEGIVLQEVIDLLDDPKNAPPSELRTHNIVHWATVRMRNTINTLPNKISRALGSVLLLVSYNPQSVPNSIHWKTLLKTFGADQSKSLVIWWSLRFTFARAKGLQLPRNQPGWA